MKYLLKTGSYKIYFRIPFLEYYLAKDMDYNTFVFVYKIWDDDWEQYQWKEI